MVAPNLLHILLLGLALLCVRFTVRETRHRAMTPWQLALPPLLAGGCALVLLFFSIGAHQPPLVFALAAGGGLAVGALRGLTTRLEIDHMFDVLRLPRARGVLVVALVVLGAVLLEAGSALAGGCRGPLCLVAPGLAAAGAGLLAGRAASVAARWRRAPHVDLRRA